MAAKDATKTVDTVMVKAAPSTTSRPIVPSRPFMAVDPMLKAETASATPKTTATPATSPKEPSESTSQAPSREAKTVAVPAPNDAPETPPTPSDVASTTNSSANPSSAAVPLDTVPLDALAETEAAAHSAEEAATAREEELEQHIAAGTYFVPIGQIKRRTRRRILGVVGVVLVGLLVLNILLDTGVLSFEHIPHTTFFQ